MAYQSPDNMLLPPLGAERMDGEPMTYASGDHDVDPKSKPNHPGQPRRAAGGTTVVNGALQKQAALLHRLQDQMNKFAGVHNEPAAPSHDSSPSEPLRPRAEVVIYDKDGVYYIDKGDYILFPGGGIDDGEIPVVAAARETMEEADVHPLNLQSRDTIEALWPKDSGNDFWDDSDFSGERTYFFLALNGGQTEFDHPDRENFTRHSFDDARKRLRELIKDPEQAWAKANNKVRLQLVNEAARIVRLKSGQQPVKLADAARLKPITEYVLFTPDGDVVMADRKSGRVKLPTTGVGERVPYHLPVRLLPPGGVDEEDYHGYEVDLHRGNIGYVPEGYQARNAAEVLNQLYGTMGKPENRPYRDLDRARARAILRELRRRRAQREEMDVEF